jgi:hypothetical protein
MGRPVKTLPFLSWKPLILHTGSIKNGKGFTVLLPSAGRIHIERKNRSAPAGPRALD